MPPGSNAGSGSHLQRIYNNTKRITDLEGQLDPPLGTIIVNSPADVPAPVGNVITLNDSPFPLSYRFNRQIDWGNLTFAGRNVWLIGSGNLLTFQSTVSPNAMFQSNGDGFVVFDGMICSNGAGPFLDMDIGTNVDSGLLLESTFFFGDPADTGFGLGSLGRVVNANRVSFQNCFFQGLRDGVSFEGSINQVNMSNCDVESRLTGGTFTALKTLAGSSYDIFTIRDTRFNLRTAGDLISDFSLSATYSSPVQMANNFSRGVGGWITPGSMDKDNPKFITVNNDGVAAPVNSAWAGEANFSGNTQATIIDDLAPVGTPVPIGAGNAAHPLFNGDGFKERFTLTGAETQSQVFTYTGVRTRTFSMRLEIAIDKLGGGTPTWQSALRRNGAQITDSVFNRSVPNQDATLISSAVVELAPGDTVGHEVANLTNTNDGIIKSAKWLVIALN